MKRSILLFGFLLLVLAVFPAFADEPAEEIQAKPAVEDATPAPEMAPAEEGADLEALPGELMPLLTEPQPAACSPLQCNRECRQNCPGGCFCTGSCNTGYCECEYICGP